MSQNNDKFHDELMNAVDKNAKILFSANDPSNGDIISNGKKNYQDFIHFFNYGPNGISILEGDRDNNWVTTPNPDENSFTIMFPHHSVRLTKFQIHTGNTKDEKLAPDQFVLYGYNSHLKRWDVISDFQGKRLNIAALYGFDVRPENQKIFYRIFRFITLSGQMALAYIKLFGDVIAESDEPPAQAAKSGETLVDYNNKPSFICLKEDNKPCDTIFRSSVKIYGPELQCFVTVTGKPEKTSRFYDIWNTRNYSYNSEKSDKPIFLCFYFPYHEVKITGYQIQPSHKNSITSWCIIGCKDNDDEGLILDHQNKCALENVNSLYTWKTNDDYNDKSFRIIRFVGLDGIISFKRLDFYGKVVPCPSKVLTDKEIYGSFTFSHSIEEWNNAKK